METVSVFVLVESKLLKGNEISDRVIGVTTNLDDAEAHAAKGAEFEYKDFSISTDLFVLGAETTVFMKEMRDFKKVARGVQELIVNKTGEGQD